MLSFNDNQGVISAAGNIVLINVESMGTVGADVRGTFNSGQVDFQVTLDGTDWVAAKDEFNGGSATNTTAAGLFQFKVSGFKAFRAVGHAGTTGATINVTLHAVEID